MSNQKSRKRTLGDMYIPKYIGDPDKSSGSPVKNNIDKFKYMAIYENEESGKSKVYYANICDTADTTETKVAKYITTNEFSGLISGYSDPTQDIFHKIKVNDIKVTIESFLIDLIIYCKKK